MFHQVPDSRLAGCFNQLPDQLLSGCYLQLLTGVPSGYTTGASPAALSAAQPAAPEWSIIKNFKAVPLQQKSAAAGCVFKFVERPRTTVWLTRCVFVLCADLLTSCFRLFVLKDQNPKQ